MKKLRESLLDDEDTLLDKTGDYAIIKKIILSHCNTSGHFIDEYNYKRELTQIDPILEEKFDKIFTIKNRVVDINLLKINKVKNLSIYIDEEFYKYVQLGNYTNDYVSGSLHINAKTKINSLQAKNGIPNSITGIIRIKTSNINNLDFTKVQTNNKSEITIWNDKDEEKTINFSNNPLSCLSLKGHLNVLNYPNAGFLSVDTFAASTLLKKLTGLKYVSVFAL